MSSRISMALRLMESNAALILTAGLKVELLVDMAEANSEFQVAVLRLREFESLR